MFPALIHDRENKNQGELTMRNQDLSIFHNFLVVVAVTFLGVGVASAGGAEDSVKRLNAQWDEALNSGDAAAVAAMYTEDGRVVTGDGNVVDGQAAIQKLFQGFIDSGFGEHKIDMIDVSESGDVIWETASWSGKGGDGKDYGGKLVNVYQKQGDGGYKARLHIWN